MSTQNLEQLIDEVRAEHRERRGERFYPRNHRRKYAEHEFAKVCGIAVRKLSAEEIAEFRDVVDRGPLKPIRLNVIA